MFVYTKHTKDFSEETNLGEIVEIEAIHTVTGQHALFKAQFTGFEPDDLKKDLIVCEFLILDGRSV